MFKVAVLDSEKEYLRQLCAYIAVKKYTNLVLEIYSEWETFRIHEDDINYDAIIMSVDYWENSGELKKDPRVILLSEDIVPKEAGGMKVVSKYQAVGSMIAQIVELSQAGERREESWIQAVRGELIGIYSPVKHEGQMLFSMTLAQMMGEDKRVLYLNFMENSGFSYIYQINKESGLSNIFYDAMLRKGDISHSISCTAVTIDKVDCIPPVQNPEHLLEFSEELYKKLFYELKMHSGYDTIIVDFGNIFPGFVNILSQCSSICCIGKEGFASRCRMQEFEEYMDKQTGLEVNINKLTLPEGLEIARREDILQMGIYGSLGDFIRKSVLGGAKFE